MDCFTFDCFPGLVPVPRLGKKGLVKCHMSASQVLNAPTYYTTLSANDASPDSSFCNQGKPWKHIAFHRSGGRQIFGGAKDFSQISRNLPEKTLKKMTSKKRLHFIPFWAHFFQIKALQVPFLPKFPPNLPKFSLTCLKKNWRNMSSNKKKHLHFYFGRHFCKIKAYKAILRRFLHILPKFTQIFPGF